MSRKTLSLASVISLTATMGMAEAPQVAVDIAPLHSLVARVMDGVGKPDLIISAASSPHEYSLRPSEAAAIQDADLVFWIGSNLTPWLENAIETLAKDAVVTEFMELEDTVKLSFREGALFDAHDHDEHDGHDDHDEHDGHDDHHGHDHSGHDPHAWLSPKNASIWLTVIAQKLAAVDPQNAEIYYENAKAGQQQLNDLSAEIESILAPVRGSNFIVFHDAYQYFEKDFDFYASGAISLSDARDPSPGRIAEIQERINSQSIACVLAEPQFNPNIVATVAREASVNTGVIDPLGAGLETGKDQYFGTLRNLAKALAACL